MDEKEAVDNPGQSKFIKRLILAIVVAFSLLVIIFLVILFKADKNKSQNNNSEIVGQNQQNLEIYDESKLTENEKKIKNCFEADVFDYECSAIFISADFNDLCSKLSYNSRDKCFYKAAFVKLDEEYCGKILGESLKMNCQQKLKEAIDSNNNAYIGSGNGSLR